MVAPLPLPDFAELSKYYKYIPETGELLLIKARCPADKLKLNKPVGSLSGPSRRKTWIVKHKGRNYYVSRIAWILMTGEDPGNLLIEHRNRDSTDNRWSNLRTATGAENNYNKVFVGYTKRADNGLYRVRVSVDGKRITIGNFNTEEEAKAAALNARKNFYGEFACLN